MVGEVLAKSAECSRFHCVQWLLPYKANEQADMNFPRPVLFMIVTLVVYISVYIPSLIMLAFMFT